MGHQHFSFVCLYSVLKVVIKVFTVYCKVLLTCHILLLIVSGTNDMHIDIALFHLLGYFFFVFKVCVWVFCLIVVVVVLEGGGGGDAEQESIEMKRVNDVSQDANIWTRLNFVDLMWTIAELFCTYFRHVFVCLMIVKLAGLIVLQYWTVHLFWSESQDTCITV